MIYIDPQLLQSFVVDLICECQFVYLRMDLPFSIKIQKLQDINETQRLIPFGHLHFQIVRSQSSMEASQVNLKWMLFF